MYAEVCVLFIAFDSETPDIRLRQRRDMISTLEVAYIKQ